MALETLNIKHFRGGGLSDQAAASSEAPAETPTETSFATIPAKGKGVLSPEQTSDLLIQMEKMLEQKTSPMSQFLGGVQDALAYTVPQFGGNQALALQQRSEQRNKEMQDVFNMRQNMASLQSRQAQIEAMRQGAKATGWAGGQGGAGGGAGGVSDLSPEDIAMYNQLLVTDPDAAQKFQIARMTDIGKARAGFKYGSGNDIVEVPFTKPNGSLGMRQMLRKDAISAIRPAEAATLPTVSRGGSEDAREAIKRGIFGQESSSGAADTSKPNAQGVQGPMQIKDTTFKMYQDLGVIPKNFKIDNPRQNKMAGDLIVDYLYDQHGGDTRKVAAEYYGGSGAINKDGSINVNQRNATRPQDPNVGQYVDQVHQKAGLGLPGAATQAPQVRPAAAAAPAPAYNVASTQPVAAPSALPETSAFGAQPPVARVPRTAGPIDIAEAKAAGKIAEETQLAKIEGEKELSRGGGKATNELFRFADEASRLRPLLKKVREHAEAYPDEFAVAARPGTSMGAATWAGRIAGGPEGREFVEENLPSTLIRPNAKERRDETASAATQIGIKAIPDMFSGNGSVRVGAQISNLVQSGKGLGVGLSAEANAKFSKIAEIGLDRAEMMANAVKELRKTNPKATVDDLPKATLWKIDDWTEKQFEDRGVIAKLTPKEAAAEELRKRKIRNITGIE